MFKKIFVLGSCGDLTIQNRKIKRIELFKVLQNEKLYKLSSFKCNERLIRFVLDKFGLTEPSEYLLGQIKAVIKVFVTKLLLKWRDCNYMYERFITRHTEWLQGDLNFSEILRTPPSITPTSSVTERRGRPKKIFEESSDRSRQRDVSLLVSDFSTQKLCFAAESSLRKAGKREAAQVVKLAVTSSPKRLKKMKQVHNTVLLAPTIRSYSPDEALSLIVDLGLTKEDYLTMRLGAKERGANIYPSYQKIAEEKKKCYPSNINVTETEATVPLQDLLDLTVKRLVQVQSEVIAQNILHKDILEVFYKWGLDGSGGIYKQNFSNNSEYADSNIILCTIVPLEVSVKVGNSKKILWKNISTSSIRYCRPVSFKLKKETNTNVKEEYDIVKNQIEQLLPTKTVLADKELSFVHIPVCTMLDGKTVNVLTETSSTQACNVCKATPKDMNDLQNLKKKVCDTSTYKFGIPVLHAYIRCYEYLLHISYKLELKQWQAKGEEAKQKVKERKSRITSLFYRKMGLVVDQPKQGGGNSNDGNTARKFFNNPLLASQITGIDKVLIERFSNILSVISSGHYIQQVHFKEYCYETAEMAVSLYNWYKMSASAHKLLLHGADIIESLPLPVGQLSEDVIEAGHKTYKNLRQGHSKKISRIDTNLDILNWMLVFSDPVITSKQKKTKKIEQVLIKW